MPSDLSPSQVLAGVLLGEPLADFVAARRHPDFRRAWRVIANELRVATDGKVAVTGETLRLWYGDDLSEKAEAS